ncbi:M23 family metallopeptidase [Aquimarina sp. MMG015]|uniref:M23 family metallopeptidase n=1 Tax=Aquimarina sp. MMG015 TaxID=2822689 RepID=UPI001B3A67EE|nr:M23 family metallopeptidase [Aquimarina sp. MMG015]MBQ4805774.1 M23 family metallopeptidase [Aquimarina sp. MMG015]
MITSTTRRFLTSLLIFIGSLYRNKRTRKFTLIPLVVIGLGFLVPQKMIIPVQGATIKDWDDHSFWAYPWGSSVTHKGIDIFKEKGTDVISSTHGIVMYTYEGGKGGKTVMVLGPKWRFHYYAHLDQVDAFPFQPVNVGTKLGTVGNTKGKPPHLHYAVTTPFPYWWLRDPDAIQGNRKMFYLNPDTWFRK